MPYGASSRAEDPVPVGAEAMFDAHCKCSECVTAQLAGANASIDEPESVDGMPCAIQVIAPRFQDEECLDALRVIDRDLRA